MMAEVPVTDVPIAAVICAAGASARMGSSLKKEYRLLHDGGMTVLGAAVSAFAAVPCIQTIVITVPADPVTGEAAARRSLPPRLLTKNNSPAIHFVPGGPNRRASVYNALALLASASSAVPAFVLIHDGARPWISPALISRVIAAAVTCRAVVPLMPLTETPKETAVPLDAAGDGPVVVKQHLRRAVIGAAQTPQAFAFPAIFTAHAQAAELEQRTRREFTDDAEIWAEFCGPVAAIPGEAENRKITFPEDLTCSP